MPNILWCDNFVNSHLQFSPPPGWRWHFTINLLKVKRWKAMVVTNHQSSQIQLDEDDGDSESSLLSEPRWLGQDDRLWRWNESPAAASSFTDPPSSKSTPSVLAATCMLQTTLIQGHLRPLRSTWGRTSRMSKPSSPSLPGTVSRRHYQRPPTPRRTGRWWKQTRTVHPGQLVGRPPSRLRHRIILIRIETSWRRTPRLRHRITSTWIEMSWWAPHPERLLHQVRRFRTPTSWWIWAASSSSSQKPNIDVMVSFKRKTSSLCYNKRKRRISIRPTHKKNRFLPFYRNAFNNDQNRSFLYLNKDGGKNQKISPKHCKNHTTKFQWKWWFKRYKNSK